MVQRVRDELLAGAALAPDHHGGAGAHDLCHLLVDPPHRSAVADDVGELVALAQLLAQLAVLLHQPLAFTLDQPVDADRLRDHRRDDPQRLDHPLGVLLRHEEHFDAERSGAGALQENRHTEKAHVHLLGALRSRNRAVEEAGLLTHMRHHRGNSSLGDAAGDPLAHAIADPARAPGIAEGGLDHEQATGLLDQGDGASAGAAAALEHFEHAVQAGLEAEGPGQRLRHFEQRGELADIAGLIGECRKPRRFGGGACGTRLCARLGPAARGLVGKQRRDIEDDLAWSGRHGWSWKRLTGICKLR